MVLICTLLMFHQVANGVYACQRTFLDDPQWKDVPWEDDLPAKSSFDYFVDVLCDVPSFLQQVTCRPRSSEAANHPNAQLDQTLMQRQILDRLRILRDLREEWYQKYSQLVWETPPKVITETGPDRDGPPKLTMFPCQTALYFQDMWRAYEFCISTATMILLFMLHEQVSHTSSPTSPYPSTALQSLLPKVSLQSLIQDICRCTEYMLLERHGSRGYIVLMFPASIAYFASSKDSLEAKWLYDVCKRHAGTSGFGFGDLMLDQILPLSMWMDDWKKRCFLGQSWQQNLGLRTLQGASTAQSAPSMGQVDTSYVTATARVNANSAFVSDNLGKAKN